MKKRLFIKLPLYILFFCFLLTIVLPLAYWVITGKDITDFVDKIQNI